ncbi:hypothetical protein J19TS1_15570 [Heyndrickxia oleronia]|nr:hypothetical protein J19TS1_15570 [Heyndrickxia oleronia]
MVLFPNIVAILSKVLTKINLYKNRLNPIECRCWAFLYKSNKLFENCLSYEKS